MNYYYSIGGADVAGPHSLAELKDLQRSGALPPSTQVCGEGEQNWQSVVSILAAPPVPVPPSGEWYYSQNGKRIGPVTLDVISSLVTSQTITRDTQIWREGMSDWTHAGKTELEGLFGAVRTPPPLMGESVSNRLVWILAFAPIMGAILGQLIELAVGFPECGILITIILNIGWWLRGE